jgi:hypothetical protein
MENWCLTSGRLFSGALNPGNWGIDVVEVILASKVLFAVDLEVEKGCSSSPLLYQLRLSQRA